MAEWRQDITYAVRRLSKAPGFTAAALISIGLGIAANSTVFSMVSTFVLRPPPVADPGALATVYTTDHSECCSNFSWPLYTDVRDQAQSFTGVAAYFPIVPASIGGEGEPERVWGQTVTANFFNVARTGMTLGRGFAKNEATLPVIVLGYRLWQRRFNGDRNIVGKAIELSGRPFTVVGVAQPAFHGLEFTFDAQFWVPLDNMDKLMPGVARYGSRSTGWLTVVARTKPGISRTQATTELNVLAGRLAQAYPGFEKGRGFHLEPGGSLPPKYKTAVTLFLSALMSVVLLVLCIACANVANLLLAQASSRRREMAVRLALGATRSQLLRQMLTESALLAFAGSFLGIVVALWTTRALAAFRLPLPIPLNLSVDMDWRVLAYTVVLSLGSALLFGLAPAWIAARPVLTSALKGEDALAGPGSRWNLRNLLVVAQIAMSLVLLCATGLFLRSLAAATRVDVGFRSRGVLMMAIDPRLNEYTPERTLRLLGQVRDRVSSLPGVLSSAWTDVAPLSIGGTRDGFHVEGQPDSSGTGPVVDLYLATPGYFETIGIPQIAGRDFRNESPAAPKVAVVNEEFARRLFGNGNPIGQRVTTGRETYRIIGVVGNIKSRTLGENVRPVLFRSLDQTIKGDPSFLGYCLLVRFSGGDAPVARAVRHEIHTLDPALAVFDAETMAEHVRDALFLPRLAGTLFGIFGLTGLLLAAVGLYGVMSYSVSRRTREIGIRLALGAQTGGVQRLIVRQGMMLTAIALVFGLVVAWAVARFSSAILYGISPHDTITFTAVPLFLAAVALLACWLPSRRASRVDPLAALRYE